jgi:hypothetical protein
MNSPFDTSDPSRPPRRDSRLSSPLELSEKAQKTKVTDKSTRGVLKALFFGKVLETARQTHKNLHAVSETIHKKPAGPKDSPEQLLMMEQLEDIIDQGFSELMVELNRYEKMARDL